MTEPTINLSELLRAKLAAAPAPDAALVALHALTNEEVMDALLSVQFELSPELEAHRKLLHTTALKDLPPRVLMLVTKAVYEEVLAHLTTWRKGWDKWATKMLTQAANDLRQCDALKKHLPKLTVEHQTYYWDALAGKRLLDTELNPLLDTQVAQFKHAVESLLAVVACYQSVPQLLPVAGTGLRAALDALVCVNQLLDEAVYGLERDHVNALGYLQQVAPPAGQSLQQDEDDDVPTQGAVAGHTAVHYDADDVEWHSEPYGHSPLHPSVNPTTGLPMVGDSYMDVGGHMYGTGMPGEV